MDMSGMSGGMGDMNGMSNDTSGMNGMQGMDSGKQKMAGIGAGMVMRGPAGHGSNAGIVQPGAKISSLVTADAMGGWAYHCHLLYHMLAMFRVVFYPGDNLYTAAPR